MARFVRVTYISKNASLSFRAACKSAREMREKSGVPASSGLGVLGKEFENGGLEGRKPAAMPSVSNFTIIKCSKMNHENLKHT